MQKGSQSARGGNQRTRGRVIVSEDRSNRATGQVWKLPRCIQQECSLSSPGPSFEINESASLVKHVMELSSSFQWLGCHWKEPLNNYAALCLTVCQTWMPTSWMQKGRGQHSRQGNKETVLFHHSPHQYSSPPLSTICFCPFQIWGRGGGEEVEEGKGRKEECGKKCEE